MSLYSDLSRAVALLLLISVISPNVYVYIYSSELSSKTPDFLFATLLGTFYLQAIRDSAYYFYCNYGVTVSFIVWIALRRNTKIYNIYLDVRLTKAVGME